MSLFYSDPEKAPRKCPECCGAGAICQRGKDPCPCGPICLVCHGTGRLGPEAKPDVEVWFSGLASPEWVASKGGDCARWYWSKADDADPSDEHGPHPTESAALAAARRALGVRS